MSLQKIELPFDVELLPVHQLSAGNITCLYEAGNLRYIKYGGEEVVRMIYTAVRDENWATAPYEIENEVVERNESSFLICYTAFYQLNDIRFKAKVRLEGKENNLSFSMEGEALSDFQRNRIGICVLHPIRECAGKGVIITHPDDTTEEGVFPQLVSAHQPFKGIKKIQWRLTSAANALLEFEGDVFETEDQRNWTDYSFKTYSTPLELPIPVRVNKGDSINQKITLTLVEDKTGVLHHQPKERLPIVVKFPFPKLGYERDPRSPHLTDNDIELLQQIPFDHYRVALNLSEPSWKDELRLASSEATELDAKLELIVSSASFEENQLQELIENFYEHASDIVSILLVEEGRKVSSVSVLQRSYGIIKAVLPKAKIGYGTDGFFAELNRNRPEQNLPFDFLNYSINPQVHAFDTRTIIENLAAQTETIRTVETFAPGKPIHISPLTFKIRENKKSLSFARNDEDQRMYTSFGAMWTLLTIKNLAGAERITLYQAKSYRGVLNEQIPMEKNRLYKALKKLKSFAPKFIVIDGNNNEHILVENESQELLISQSLPDTVCDGLRS